MPSSAETATAAKAPHAKKCPSCGNHHTDGRHVCASCREGRFAIDRFRLVCFDGSFKVEVRVVDAGEPQWVTLTSASANRIAGRLTHEEELRDAWKGRVRR